MTHGRPLNHIACIDDDEDILRVAEMTLKRLGGFKVSAYSSAADALEHLPSSRPDLVLLDVMMPKMDGPATLDAIRKHPQLSHLPVVFMTAKIQPSERHQYNALGASGVLAKPFDPATLSRDVEELWQTFVASEEARAH
jgi:two-component system, OmpR family, response regulator